MKKAKKTSYKVSVIVTDKQGKKVFSFNSSNFNKQKFEELLFFLNPNFLTIKDSDVEDISVKD